MSASPTLSSLKKLYGLMAEIKTLAPWKWMCETDVFGVQNPHTKEVGFVSIMGQAGEHYAVAAYLGEVGLFGLWRLHEAGPNISPEMIFETPQLQASFENREMLHPQDRDQIKKLGLKFRGRNAWPLFRSYRPGCFPWYLDKDEVLFLQYILEQTLEVAPRFKKDPDLLEPGSEDEYLVRTASKKGKQLTWKDATMHIPPPGPVTVSSKVDSETYCRFKELPKSRISVEIDFFMTPIPIRGEVDRPFYPYMLLMVDSAKGLVVGTELLQPIPSLQGMWEEIPQHLIAGLAKLNLKPAKISVRSDLLYSLLHQLCADLEITLQGAHRLPMLDEARASLEQMFGKF